MSKYEPSDQEIGEPQGYEYKTTTTEGGQLEVNEHIALEAQGGWRIIKISISPTTAATWFFWERPMP